MVNKSGKTLFLFAASAVLLLSGCAKNPYSSGKLEVVLKNNSDATVRDVSVFHGDNRFGAASLQPGEKVKTVFTLENPLELQFQYFNADEGAVVQVFPIPARVTDGGEVVFTFNQDQSVTRVSRFDVY